MKNKNIKFFCFVVIFSLYPFFAAYSFWNNRIITLTEIDASYKKKDTYTKAQWKNFVETTEKSKIDLQGIVLEVKSKFLSKKYKVELLGKNNEICFIAICEIKKKDALKIDKGKNIRIQGKISSFKKGNIYERAAKLLFLGPIIGPMFSTNTMLEDVRSLSIHGSLIGYRFELDDCKVM